MAFSTTPAAGEYVSRGPMGARGTYTTKRKHSLSDEIVWQARRWNLFDNILRRELKVIEVADPAPKVLTKQEAPIKFNIKSDGTTTIKDEDTLLISDTQAKFLQKNDVLLCNQIFCDSDGANYSTTKYDSGYTPESMIVDSVTLSGASSGVANVIVKRGNGACPASSVTTVLSEYKLIRANSAHEDGWTAPAAIQHEPTEIENYLQTFSKTWSETEMEGYMDVYGKEPMSDKGRQKQIEFFREIDAAFIMGRKQYDVVDGQNRYMTGGILEYIPGSSEALDGTSRFMDFGGAWELDTFREKMEIAFRYGSDEKVAFCGGKFFTVLLNNLEKYVRMNDGLSKKWGWHVYSLETGHGLLNLMRHPLLSELDTGDQQWAYDMIGVDLDYVDLMKHKGMDVKVKTNVQDNDVHQKKNELYGVLGLRRTHPSAHFVVYGITG
jgi:hypothetical protein